MAGFSGMTAAMLSTIKAQRIADNSLFFIFLPSPYPPLTFADGEFKVSGK